MNCRGKKQVAFEGMELSCALLARALMRFKSFSEFSLTCSLMLFGKSSRFFPINHLWHIFFPVFKVALSHDRKACTASFSCRSENVWKMYSFEFLICFMQEMCNCGLTSCLINASQAHHQSLSSCFVGFFPTKCFSMRSMRDVLAGVKGDTVRPSLRAWSACWDPDQFCKSFQMLIDFSCLNWIWKHAAVTVHAPLLSACII